MKETKELEQRIQTKDDLIGNIREEMESLIQAADKRLEMVDDIKKVLN